VGNYNESTASSLGYTYDPNTGNLASKAGLSYTYGDPNHAHAVTSLSNGFGYQYDPNGNMTRRNLGSEVFNLAYDPENHLVQVSGTVTATYGYDGDGKRVLSTEGITTTVYLGNYFEMSVSGAITSTVKYYYAGADRIAMRQNGGAVKWLLGDHLGSTSLVYDGSQAIRQGYEAWGERRFILGGEELPTTFRYTGQREDASIGLYYYGARWYDPVLVRFIQPDNFVPGLGNPTSFDRFSYTYNNPLVYIDPSGHSPWDSWGEFCTGFVKEFTRNVAFMSPQAQSDLAASESESDSMLLGRIAGNIGSIIVGIDNFDLGLGIATGGTILISVPTGGAGAAVTASSGAVIAVFGAGVATAGAMGLGKNMAFLKKNSDTSGTIDSNSSDSWESKKPFEGTVKNSDGTTTEYKVRKTAGSDGGWSRVIVTRDSNGKVISVVHEAWNGTSDPRVDPPYHVDDKLTGKR
jgi:RHS repeat-associated protein